MRSAQKSIKCRVSYLEVSEMMRLGLPRELVSSGGQEANCQ